MEDDENLPLLSISNRVVLPGGYLRLSVGKPRSVKLVEDSLWGGYGDREFVVSMEMEDASTREGSLNTARSTALPVASMGCVVCVEQLARSTSTQGFEFSMLVRGLCRAQIGRILASSPFYRARVRRIYDVPEAVRNEPNSGETSKTEELAASLRDTASAFLSMLKEESGAR